MNSKQLVLRSSVTLVCLLLVKATLGDEKNAQPKAGEQAGSPDMQEMMKRWEEYATPGAGHKVLEALTGEWDVEIVSWMGGQGTPAMTSKGTAKVQWVL